MEILCEKFCKLLIQQIKLIMSSFRVESDLLGEQLVPVDAFYGVQTQRAIDNFKISNQHIADYSDFVVALAKVKKAAAITNHELGLLATPIFEAIDKACDALIAGEFHQEFPIDMLQGGAGTSTNMNANEVIANLALTSLGMEKGDYSKVSPNDHVNLSQSTNDAYPTAIKIAVYTLHQKLVAELDVLAHSLSKKATEFESVIKMGRTQLQDAVPMTLGQEFGGFAHLISTAIKDLHTATQDLLEVNMGATAIGTGINAPEKFDILCAQHLSAIVGAPIRPAENLIAATSDTSAFVGYSAALKKLSLKLTKICNDLRLLASGPRAGLFEIQLPQRQPGSSIMPGKVNPVIPEVVNQICYKVMGNDLTITLAAENAQLQLNVMEPVIALSLFESMTLLTNGIQTLYTQCIDGIIANEENALQLVKNSIGIVTALNPYIGYKASSKLAKEALQTHKSIEALVLEKELLSQEELEQYLDPKTMI